MLERNIDRISAVLLLGFSLLMLSQLEGVPVEGVLFPQTLLYILIAGSLLLIIRSFLRQGKVMSFFGDIPRTRWLAGAGLFLAQVWSSMYLSFLPCMAVGMFAMLCLLNPDRRPRTLLVQGVVTAVFIVFFHVFFTMLMNIYFPGALGE